MNKRTSRYNREFQRMRKVVYERDNGLCVLCGAQATEVHHIVFRSQLGTNSINNLACLCRACHEMAHGVQAKEVRLRLATLVNLKEAKYEKD